MNKIFCSLLTIVIALCFASCEKAILNNGKEVGKSCMVLMFIRREPKAIRILNMHTDCLTTLQRLVLF